MKNKEKYASEIIEIACSGNAVSVSKVTGKPIACEKNNCANCYRCNDFLLCDKERLKEWAELDHIEKPVISKRDRAFFGVYWHRNKLYNQGYGWWFVHLYQQTT